MEKKIFEMRHVILRLPYEKFIIFCILANSIVLVYETSFILSPYKQTLVSNIEMLFMWIFIIEITIKILIFRKKFFNYGWNWFDFIVTVISSIPFISFLNALRALRLLRLIKHIKSLRRVVEALALSIPGMISTCALLLIIYLVFGIITTKMFAIQFPQWFGSLSESLYSLFQIMTLESWSMGIVRPVMEIYPYAWVIFVPFILLTSFILLNFIIGIIVDSISELKNMDKKEDLESKIELIYQEIKLLKKK